MLVIQCFRLMVLNCYVVYLMSAFCDNQLLNSAEVTCSSLWLADWIELKCCVWSTQQYQAVKFSLHVRKFSFLNGISLMESINHFPLVHNEYNG